MYSWLTSWTIAVSSSRICAWSWGERRDQTSGGLVDIAPRIAWPASPDPVPPGKSAWSGLLAEMERGWWPSREYARAYIGGRRPRRGPAPAETRCVRRPATAVRKADG